MAATTEPGLAAFPVPPLAARLFDLARAEGYEARIVGGAVRDWLAGLPIGDIDMAVAAPIDAFADACRADGIRVIETGLSHGTVTVLSPARPGGANPDAASSDSANAGIGGPIEGTQTRVDLETDGRHAVVGFSDDWKADASRRDFTINAIYIDADGQIDDPLGGRADLESGTLRFAGNAAQRVEEARLSGERVAAECRRLFGMDDGAAGIRLLQDTGIAAHALGTALEPGHLAHLADKAGFDAGIDPHQAWLVRLAALTAPGRAPVLAQRLRLSRQDSRLLAGLDSGDSAQTVALLNGPDWQQGAYVMVRGQLPPAALLVVAAARCGRTAGPDHLAMLASWVPPEFPLAAADLLSHGVDKGPCLGEMLRAAEAHWVGQDFAPSRQDLIDFAMTSG